MSRRIPVGEAVDRLLQLEERLGGSEAPAAKRTGSPAPTTPRKGAEAPPLTEAPRKSTDVTPATTSSSDAERFWSECVEAARQKSLPLGAKLSQAAAISLDTASALVLGPSQAGLRGLLAACLAEAETQSFLRDFVTAQGLPKLQVVLQGETLESPAPAKTGASRPKSAVSPEPGPPQALAAPAPAPSVEKDTRTMGQLFQDEPMLQKALDMFDGEVIP
jgi:hypothetical protein